MPWQWNPIQFRQRRNMEADTSGRSRRHPRPRRRASRAAPLGSLNLCGFGLPLLWKAEWDGNGHGRVNRYKLVSMHVQCTLNFKNFFNEIKFVNKIAVTIT
jgi:hypothetical protein